VNHALDNLASDLQKTIREGRAMLSSQNAAKETATTVSMYTPSAYDPSASVDRLNVEQVEYNRLVDGLSFGDIR